MSIKFHDLLKQCIEQAGSQRAFAKKIGIAQSTINSWLYVDAPEVQIRLLRRLGKETDISYKAWVNALMGEESSEEDAGISSNGLSDEDQRLLEIARSIGKDALEIAELAATLPEADIVALKSIIKSMGKG